MTDIQNPPLASVLREKLQEILARRTANERTKSAAAAEDLAIDRDLADLRAACRVLKVDLPFPEAKEDDRLRASGHLIARMADIRARVASIQPPRVIALADVTVEDKVPSSIDAAIARPPIKDIVLDCLKTAGDEGMEAAKIRAHIDRVYGGGIHEKTVGMTLYRLSKEGLVRRKGRTWFLVRPSLEGKKNNPGGGPPGSIEAAQ